jgi:predicted transcriptional regulator
VEELMTTHVITCRSSDRVEAVMALMTMQRIRHLPVVDDGALKGMISIGDLVKVRLDEKELEANTLREISRMRA